jgi:hypothetical protein
MLRSILILLHLLNLIEACYSYGGKQTLEVWYLVPHSVCELEQFCGLPQR